MTPKGTLLPDWTPRIVPPGKILEGRYARLEPLDPKKHGDDMVAAFRTTDPESWTYLFHGPFADEAGLRKWLADSAVASGNVCYAIVDSATGRALGIASYMRIDQANGVIEVGSIHYSDALKQTRASTEAMYLMMRHVFDDLGYRRYEWKCNAFNEPSRRTALRLGFSFEGIFRNHMIVKGRSRDTAWFAIANDDWPALKSAYEKWLAPDNFDSDSRQKKSLAAIIGAR
ncbi:MAG: GNAT family N-acetyltransferase [Rhizobiales bacterium]|nr:GNAT family N-acetyltransferase [Hyphomicrobiales bacterium]